LLGGYRSGFGYEALREQRDLGYNVIGGWL
jgi:hypothetical protein